MALSGDGKRLLTSGSPGGMRGIQLWDVGTGNMTQMHEIPTGAGDGCLSPDGKLAILSGGGYTESGEQITMQLWDFERGKPVLSLKREGPWSWGPPVAFSPDSKRFVAGRWSGILMLFLWDAQTGERVRQMGEIWVNPTPAAAFTADGKHLLVVSSGRLERIAVADGKPVWTVPIPKDVFYAAFTPDGTLALTVRGTMRQRGGERMTFTLWDTALGEKLRELKPPE
jgi:WD40 repeat protein